MANADLQGGSLVKFEVQCFRSREYVNEVDKSEDEEKEESTVYVMRMKRLEGTALNFNRIKRVIIFERCASVLTGLPKDILRKRKLQAISNREKGLPTDLLDDVGDEEEDDYDQILAQDNNVQVAIAAQ